MLISTGSGTLRGYAPPLALRAGVIAEGAGAAASAAVLADRIAPRRDETSVIVVSGRNVTADRLREVLA